MVLFRTILPANEANLVGREQLVKNRDSETIKADNYLSVNVISAKNTDLLLKTYKCSGVGPRKYVFTYITNLLDRFTARSSYRTRQSGCIG